MKKIYVPFAVAFLFLISSCSKDTPTPIPVAPKLDTLTAGWKKIIVDTSETYADVFFNNSTTGYLAGNKTYKSTDGGLSWNSISPQSFANLGVTGNGNAFFAGGGSNGLFKSTNGTGPLTKVKVSTSVSSDVFFVDDNNGYYLDEGGLFNSTDAGANWTKVTTTGVNFASGSFITLFFSNNNTGWITSQNTVYKTSGSASNWVAASFTGKAPSTLFTSVFTTPDNTVYTLGNNAELYKSTNGGTSFSLIQTFQTTGGYFGDIYFVDNNTGYVSGGNKIFKTTDAGSTWTVVVTLADIQIVEIHFSDSHHGWASCAKGTVLVFNN